ncbi:MAG: putative surface protein with fasciclin (FAS1) repeats [Alphaproteobacteria bacterium]|jgi:uncharacterized surface protein with fasciclin (FAS1) repeats
MKLLNLKSLFIAIVATFAIAVTAQAGHHGAKKDIVDVAAGDPDFSTLVTAIKAAGLVDALKADGPLTVFAPTNAAFAKLPAGTVDNLLKPENKEWLGAVLTYHIVAGKVMAADVVKVDSATSLQGQAITVMVTDGKVKVNKSNVVATDIKASNGVIHAIDTVLFPSE